MDDDNDEYLVTIPTLNSSTAPAASAATATMYKKRKFPMATECVGVVNIDLLKRLEFLETRAEEADAMRKRIDDLETRLTSYQNFEKRVNEISMLELRVAAAKVRAEEVEVEAEQASNSVSKSNELASELASFSEKHKQRISVETNRVLAERKAVVNEKFKEYVAFLETKKNEAENGEKNYKEAILVGQAKCTEGFEVIEKSIDDAAKSLKSAKVSFWSDFFPRLFVFSFDDASFELD
jgi:hypothetical protein